MVMKLLSIITAAYHIIMISDTDAATTKVNHVLEQLAPSMLRVSSVLTLDRIDAFVTLVVYQPNIQYIICTEECFDSLHHVVLAS